MKIGLGDDMSLKGSKYRMADKIKSMVMSEFKIDMKRELEHEVWKLRREYLGDLQNRSPRLTGQADKVNYEFVARELWKRHVSDNFNDDYWLSLCKHSKGS